LTTTVLATVACGVASADSIVQTLSFGPNSTDVTDANTDMVFDYFQSSPGYNSSDVLTSVTFSWNINQTLTTLSFSAPANLSTSQTFTYSQLTTVGADEGVTTGKGLESTDFSDLTGAAHSPDGATPYNLYGVGGGGGACAGSSQTISQGETISFLPTKGSNGPDAPTTCTTGTGQYNYLSGLVASVDPGFYNTVGDFDLSYFTTGSFSGSGGATNLNTTLRSNTTDSVTVTYNYDVASTGTPEPGTIALMGGALVGLGLIGRRHKKS